MPCFCLPWFVHLSIFLLWYRLSECFLPLCCSAECLPSFCCSSECFELDVAGAATLYVGSVIKPGVVGVTNPVPMAGLAPTGLGPTGLVTIGNCLIWFCPPWFCPPENFLPRCLPGYSSISENCPSRYCSPGNSPPGNISSV